MERIPQDRALFRWRTFLERERLLYDVPRSSRHPCWRPGPGEALPTDHFTVLNEELGLYGCNGCGRTHLCQHTVDDADDPCVEYWAPEAIESVCVFSGRVLSSVSLSAASSYDAENDLRDMLYAEGPRRGGGGGAGGLDEAEAERRVESVIESTRMRNEYANYIGDQRARARSNAVHSASNTLRRADNARRQYQRAMRKMARNTGQTGTVAAAELEDEEEEAAAAAEERKQRRWAARREEATGQLLLAQRPRTAKQDRSSAGQHLPDKSGMIPGRGTSQTTGGRGNQDAGVGEKASQGEDSEYDALASEEEHAGAALSRESESLDEEEEEEGEEDGQEDSGDDEDEDEDDDGDFDEDAEDEKAKAVATAAVNLALDLHPLYVAAMAEKVAAQTEADREKAADLEVSRRAHLRTMNKFAATGSSGATYQQQLRAGDSGTSTASCGLAARQEDLQPPKRDTRYWQRYFSGPQRSVRALFAFRGPGGSDWHVPDVRNLFDMRRGGRRQGATAAASRHYRRVVGGDFFAWYLARKEDRSGSTEVEQWLPSLTMGFLGRLNDSLATLSLQLRQRLPPAERERPDVLAVLRALDDERAALVDRLGRLACLALHFRPSLQFTPELMLAAHFLHLGRQHVQTVDLMGDRWLLLHAEPLCGFPILLSLLSDVFHGRMLSKQQQQQQQQQQQEAMAGPQLKRKRSEGEGAADKDLKGRTPPKKRKRGHSNSSAAQKELPVLAKLFADGATNATVKGHKNAAPVMPIPAAPPRTSASVQQQQQEEEKEKIRATTLGPLHFASPLQCARGRAGDLADVIQRCMQRLAGAPSWLFHYLHDDKFRCWPPRDEAFGGDVHTGKPVFSRRAPPNPLQ